MNNAPLFRSFFQGGFECSSHVRRDGRRLDVLASTRHDIFAEKDYRALAALNIQTVRDGVRWHLVEPRPGHYDFSSLLPVLRAAQATGAEVIWDLCHYGWPDGMDVFSPAFIGRFANFARATARFLRDESGMERAWISPLNEPSFLAWAGGDTGYLNPFGVKRGGELKCQLVRAIIEGAEAIWDELPQARLVHCEPAIHITADPLRPEDTGAAEGHRQFQFQALDMLAGRENPALGGHPKYLGVIGVNFYWNNEWIHNGRTLAREDRLYRPLRDLLAEFQTRYQRTVFVAETGQEGDQRASWLSYVASEVEAAIAAGVPVEGLCLYPILDYPGWDNDRQCPCGLLGFPDDDGNRPVYGPLAEELRKWQARLGSKRFALAALGE